MFPHRWDKQVTENWLSQLSACLNSDNCHWAMRGECFSCIGSSKGCYFPWMVSGEAGPSLGGQFLAPAQLTGYFSALSDDVCLALLGQVLCLLRAGSVRRGGVRLCKPWPDSVELSCLGYLMKRTLQSTLGWLKVPRHTRTRTRSHLVNVTLEWCRGSCVTVWELPGDEKSVVQQLLNHPREQDWVISLLLLY